MSNMKKIITLLLALSFFTISCTKQEQGQLIGGATGALVSVHKWAVMVEEALREQELEPY